MQINKILTAGIMVAALCLGASRASANVIFTFTEEGFHVFMRASGVLDTTKLVPVLDRSPSAGTSTLTVDPFLLPYYPFDYMQSGYFGYPDTGFTYHPGTDISAILNPGGPFAFTSNPASFITGSTSFVTHSGDDIVTNIRQPGIGVRAVDVVNGLWTPDITWLLAYTTFASLGFNPGTYSVSDAVTHETITIQIGPVAPAVPEPSTLLLLCGGLAGVGLRWRRQR